MTGIGTRASVPAWASISGRKPELVSSQEITHRERLPDVLIVRAEAPKSFLAHGKFVSSLARRQRESPGRTIILIEFKKTGRAYGPWSLADVLRPFRDRADIRLVSEPHQAKGIFVDALAQVIARIDDAPAHDRPNADPFAGVKEIIESTADLRTETGNLSAARIAEVFGIPKAELARLAGKTRQAVSQSDDAYSIQEALLPFERVARLRAVIGQNFKKWLRIPNRQLADKAPLDLILDGKVRVVADLVEDMLTGNPG